MSAAFRSSSASPSSLAAKPLAASTPARRSDRVVEAWIVMASPRGACTAITLRMYAERKQWNLGAIRVKLRLLKDGESQRIERAIHVTGTLTPTSRPNCWRSRIRPR